LHREVHARVDRGDRRNGAKAGGAGAGDRPLNKSAVRPAIEDDVAAAPRLICEPLDGVVPVGGVIDKRYELPIGVAPAASVQAHEMEATSREQFAVRVNRSAP
jgi:hypothetical protein